MQQAGRNIIALGASAGGIAAVSALLRKLPSSLPASIIVVIHRSPEQVSHLQEILRRATSFEVRVPVEGERLQRHCCYLGTPQLHVTVDHEDKFHMVPDGFYRGHCIDALFNSLALGAGKRTIGVLLSGMLKDGAVGLRAIKRAGGLAFVQSPAEAEFPDMPTSAIKEVSGVDIVGTTEELAAAITTAVSGFPSGPSLDRTTFRSSGQLGKTSDWLPISTAPYDRDLEIAVLEHGEAHAVAFPCRRILRGWMNALTREQITVRPTHWREWRDDLSELLL